MIWSGLTSELTVKILTITIEYLMLFKCKLSGNLVLWTGSRGGNRLRVSRGHTHALPATVPILALAPAEILCPGNVRTIQTLGQHDTAIRETMQKE